MQSKEIIATLRHCGIKVYMSGDVPTCLTKLTSDGYEIHLGMLYQNAPEEGQQYLLRHEIMHIARGDLVAKRVAGHKIDNIAQDCCIAHTLGEKEAEELDGVTYKTLGDPSLPKPVRGWRPLAEALKEKIKEEIKTFCKIEPSPADKEQHIESVIKLRGSELGNMMPQITGAPKKIAPIKASNLERILKLIKKSSGNLRIKERTRSRPGRIEELKGCAIIPRATITIAIDASGSMSDLIEKAQGLAYWAYKEWNVEIIAWNDQALKISVSDLPKLSAGGGTNPDCLWPLIRKSTAVVILTDGYFLKVSPPKEMPPIVWWVFKNKENIIKREQDHIVGEVK